uniref:Zinc finger C2HC-type containing 1B n=1 Tax=Gopherus evgoodei TaxID=1825980 RepID=A0A8C4WFU4_9SAUR
AAGSQDLLACETCGRHFAQDVLLRHEPICRKVFNKKRKTFNSLKQRLQGTEIPSVKKQPPPKKQPEKKSNWRQLHEDFINAIQSAKQVAKAMKEGRPLPPPPPPSINPDYIQCPYCLRRFNEAAAERHISFCKEQATRRVFAPGQKAAKQAPVSNTFALCFFADRLTRQNGLAADIDPAPSGRVSNSILDIRLQLCYSRS